MDAADGFLFPWKISKEKGKDKTKHYKSIIFQSCVWQWLHWILTQTSLREFPLSPFHRWGNKLGNKVTGPKTTKLASKWHSRDFSCGQPDLRDFVLSTLISCDCFSIYLFSTFILVLEKLYRIWSPLPMQSHNTG